MKFLQLTILLFLSSMVFIQCKKSGISEKAPAPDNFQLSYGDSIIYLKNQPGDHIVEPVQRVLGKYESYPEGLEIDDETGAINVSESETGLRYKITFKSKEGQRYQTNIVLAGINYLDRYHRLSQGDSIARPIYNASWNRSLPSSNFDEGSGAAAFGTAIKTTDGQINLAKTVRNGFFGATPRNDEQKEIEIAYRVNDNSNGALQKIRMILYYYKTMSDVPQYLKEIVQAREDMIFGLRHSDQVFEVGLGGRYANLARKPRPPCVVVIAQ
jgi:hypothetical protein